MPANGRSKDAWRAAAPTAAPGRPGTAKKAAAGKAGWLVAAFAVLAIAGVIAGLAFYFQPERDPVFLPLPVAEYADPAWPPNPWAVAEARAYGERFGDDATRAFPDQEKERLLRALGKLVDDSKSGKLAGRPLVAVVCALGRMAGDVPCLLPADADPKKPESWLTLDDLLQPLRKASVPRLLVLDVRPADLGYGPPPAADVNAGLDAALAKLHAANDLPFLVLSANTPAAGPATLRPLARTAFGLALAQGLAGHADGWNQERHKDKRVSAAELAGYVRDATAAATSACGHPRQTPKLYGTGPDFFLRHVPKELPAPPAAADPDPLPDFLAESGKVYDEWVKGHGPRRAPAVAVEGNAARARAEAQWLAGADPKAVAERFAGPERARRETAAQAPAVVPPVPTLFAAKQAGDFAAKVSAAADVLRPVFEKVRDPAAKADELDKAQKAAGPKLADMPPEAVCEAALRFIVPMTDVTFDRVRKVHAAVKEAKLKAKPVEWAAFELLAGFSEDVVNGWPPGALPRVLQAVRASGEELAFDGRNLPWLKTAVDANEKAIADAVLALGNPRATKKEREATLPALDAAFATAAGVREAARALTELRAEWEDARAEVGDLSDRFPQEFAPPAADPASAWAAVADAFRQAGLKLSPPDDGGLQPPAPAEYDQARGALRLGRAHLRDMLLVPPDATARQLERALAWPGWPTAKRAEFRGRLETRSREAAAQAVASLPAAPAGVDLGPSAWRLPEAVPMPPAAVPADRPDRPTEAAYQRWLAALLRRTAGAWMASKGGADAAAALGVLAREAADWASANPNR